MSEDDIIYVGRKPPMAYVLALLTSFNSRGAESVTLKARGRAISTAVDVAEIARNRYMTDLEPTSIEIATEEVPTMEGGTRNVSSMSITLAKTGKPAEKPEPKKEEAPPSETDITDIKEVGTATEEAPPSGTDITDIKGVGPATEEKLRKAGYETAESIAETDAAALTLKTGISEKVAARIIENSKELLGKS